MPWFKNEKMEAASVTSSEITAFPSPYTNAKTVRDWLRNKFLSDLKNYNKEAMNKSSLTGSRLQNNQISSLVQRLKEIVKRKNGRGRPTMARKIACKIWGLRRVVDGIEGEEEVFEESSDNEEDLTGKRATGKRATGKRATGP
ncbi:hypothetical protein BDZ45DRAFT_695279 [Acephala macrosclerotiorum]|nr:hypothetical protein BDZ45DRAFT_695279 [Acephala macrosclerotiorum]